MMTLFCLCLYPTMTPPLTQEMHRNLVWFLHIGLWLEVKVGSCGLCRNCSEVDRTDMELIFYFPFVLLLCHALTLFSACLENFNPICSLLLVFCIYYGQMLEKEFLPTPSTD